MFNQPLRFDVFTLLLTSHSIYPSLVLLILGAFIGCADKQDRSHSPPTYANVSYGPHERNMVDFYQANSSEPTPVLVFFHGGGFRGGNKGINVDLYRLCVENGISCAAANYRLSQHAPYPAQMHDGARAIQLLRSKAKQWNIDSRRIAAIGNSSGAGISLWLAMHDDMANPSSNDSISQQSTRLSCAIGLHAQTTYDPREIKQVVPGRAYDHSALKQLFALPQNWDWDKEEVGEKLSAKLRDASPIAHLTKDDPPIFVCHHTSREVPGEIHHANFGRYLEKKMRALDIECIRRITSDPDDLKNIKSQNQTILDFVLKHFDR